MVAVKTGFSSPSMSGMPAPMQPMGGLPPMIPMGGPGTFPAAALPAGQTPVPASVPPMPLAGFPPPPVKSQMAQQGSNAPRRRRFGDSLEGMLGRNVFAPQQQMVAPGMPMMRTPTPRPMAMGGAVQYFANGGNANQQAAASMMSAGIGNVGGKAITSGAQSIQDSFASSAAKRRKRRRKKQARLAAERAAAEQAIRDAEAAALAASQAAQQNNPNIAGPMESALQNFGGTAFQSAASSPAAPPPPSTTDITPEVFVPEVNPASGFASNLMNIEKPDRIIDRQINPEQYLNFDDAPALTQGIIPSEVVPDNPFTYDIGAIGLGDNRDDTQANLGAGTDPNLFYDPSSGTDSAMDSFDNLLSDRNAGMGFRYTNQAERDLRDLGEMDTTPPVNTTLPDDIQIDIGPGFSTSSFGQVDLGRLGDRGFTPSGTQIAPEAATIFEMTPEEQAIVGGMSAVPTAGSAVTPEELNIMSGMSAVPGAGQKITPPKAGTGVDPQADQYRPSVNAAEAAFLQEALGEFEFNDAGKLVGANPNFLEQVFGKIIRNLTFNMFDPNDPQKGEDAKAILDAYQKTGKFVYDGKEMSLEDLTNRYSGKKGDPDYKNLQAGLEPAVIGVEGPDGKTVGFTDGTGFRNIMGDYDPVFSEDGQVFSGGSDTQNIKTGSTDVFGGGDTNVITTGGSDGGGDSGSDTTGDVDLGHTVDEDGNKICNTPGYIYNPETKICELPKEEEVDGTPGSGIGTGTSGESFEDVLKRVVVAAPDVAPISANVRPMQEGGMAGLNRAADNFLQALAG